MVIWVGLLGGVEVAALGFIERIGLIGVSWLYLYLGPGFPCCGGFCGRGGGCCGGGCGGGGGCNVIICRTSHCYTRYLVNLMALGGL